MMRGLIFPATISSFARYCGCFLSAAFMAITPVHADELNNHTDNTLNLAIQDFGKSILALPEVKGMSASEQQNVIENAVLLSRNGLLRLNDNDLEKRFLINKKILNEASSAFCATMFRNEMYSSAAFRFQLMKSLTRLSKEDLDTYFQISKNALSAEIRKNPDRHGVSDEILHSAFDAMLKNASTTDAERFRRVFGGDLYTATDADTCWVAKFTYARVPATDKPYKAALIRMFIQ